jgi:hypothetical protein
MPAPPRPTQAFLLELLGVGLFVALVRISWRTHGFGTPGRAALTDLLGCALAAAALWAVLALQGLGAGRALAEELEDGLAAVALAVWLVALVPPRAENYLPGGATDDFPLAYAPVSLAAALLVVAARRWWPGRAPRQGLLRHLAALAVLVLALGGLVRHVSGGPGATSVLHRCLGVSALLAAGWAAVRWGARGRGSAAR